ncbi:ATP-binding protein [Sphingomonas sp. DG1-23]|uniref:ATP-binding protein n=1 Tax=Sphingomonas sp. DG1-23 TaxID=3068316 RepID=UPI00273D52F1|nr:ATP-binding protein [Sphingomonas sp. DG1-23]MDP5279830.1 ATP-binding protein [Sphingomonas sp. DG1-23]
MSDETDAWLERNNAYLAAALAHLRELLRAAIGPAPASPQSASGTGPTEPAGVGSPGMADWPGLNLFRRRTPANAVPQVLLLPAAEGVDPPAVTLAAERLAEASAGDPPPALLMLASRLDLSDFERDILLLCLAAELDPGMQESFAAAQGGQGRSNPSFALAMSLFDHAAWDALSPERPLRYWHLIETARSGATPLTTAALRIDERVANFAKGLNHLDSRVAALLEPAPASSAPLAPSHQQRVAEIERVARRPVPARIALVGPDRDSKQRLAAAAAAALGLPCYRLTADAIPIGAELDNFLRLWMRESLLLPFALHLDAHDLPSAAEQSLRRLVRRAGGLVFVDLRDGLSGLDIDARVDIAKPGAAEQRAEWLAQLDEVPDNSEIAARLSSHFDLNFADIRAIVSEAQLGEESEPLGERLWRGSVTRARPSLAQLAHRIEVKPSCRDIVLPDSEMALLDQIAAQVRGRSTVYDDWGFRDRMNRGLGVSALFAGDSGTGKTMAAETLADRLDLDLYRIDLSAVVSKYIGETEKNLRDVFDAAEAGGAILFFDEADALFGKRSDVKDSHDRYANIEIDYLLQRMEAFAGLAILATNMKSALDPAFVRRLRFIVNFPYPGPAERRRIWERAFPPGVPMRAVDFDRLAQLDLTGGNIHGIAINAAFMAAAADTPVTMDVLLDACRIELRKLDRPVNEADFRRIRAVAGEVR